MAHPAESLQCVFRLLPHIDREMGPPGGQVALSGGRLRRPLPASGSLRSPPSRIPAHALRAARVPSARMCAPCASPVCVVPPSPVVSDKALATLRSYAEKGGRLVLLPPFNTLDANLRPKGAAAYAPGWKGDVTLVGDFSGRYDAHPHEPADYASKFDDAFVLNKGRGRGRRTLRTRLQRCEARRLPHWRRDRTALRPPRLRLPRP